MNLSDIVSAHRHLLCAGGLPQPGPQFQALREPEAHHRAAQTNIGRKLTAEGGAPAPAPSAARAGPGQIPPFPPLPQGGPQGAQPGAEV